MQLRHVRLSDCDRVLAVIDEWGGGPATSSHLPHVCFSHLAPTSFVLEQDDGELVGFLLGFLSQAHPDEACVHMVGVHPAFRRLGFGRRLCERFFLTAQMHGRRWVRSVSTSSGPSIAFHRAVGFVPLHGDAVIDDLPVRRDYAGAGGQRVVFRRGIVHDAPAAEAGAAPAEPGAEMGLKEALTSQVRRERPLRRGRLRRLSRRSRTAGPSRHREAPGGRGSCSRSWDSRWLRSAPFPGGRP